MPKAGKNDRETMLGRIEGLLRLAKDQGATPGEAAAAMHAAQRLMQKHQISELEAEAHGTQARAKFGHEDLNVGYKGIPIDAKRSLLHGSAKACYCHAVMYQGKAVVSLLGRSENRQAVKLMFTRLELEVMRLAATDARRAELDARASGRGFIGALPWKNRFAQGAAMEIARRLEAYRDELDAELYRDAPQSQGLMVVEARELDEYLRQTHANARDANVRQKVSEAYRRGERAGRDVDLGLHRKLGGGN